MCTTLSRMATRNFVLFTYLFAYLLFLFTFPSHASSPYSDDNGVKVLSSINSDKVTLSLYYDSLCRHSANFIVKHLVGVFEKDLITIINLRLVPWGNARIIESNNTVRCQHGPDECMLNTVEACAINIWHDVNQHYGLIYCFEFLVIEGRQKDWKTCFDSLGLPHKPILDCYSNGNGTKFELQYANETANLKSPHAFVPWVVVNDQPLQQDFDNFASYVCKAYKGTAIPEACRLAPPKFNSTAVHPVCYMSEVKKLISLTPSK